ncbi:MAG: acyl-CoA dehydrogenase, partial [Limisphaerales bacterium]
AHQLFRQSLRDFISKEVTPNAAAWEKAREIPKSVWLRMGELGYLGVPFSESQGGLGLDFFHSVIFLEEIARSTMGGFTAAVSVHAYMATAHIAKTGSAELKQKYLSPSISGEKWGALGISEPFAGSDVAAIRTTAKREGGHYIINGSKTFITNGVCGDFVTLACKTKDAGTSGISLIVVDQGTAGFSATKLDKMGWHSSDTGELSFDNVRVPVSNLVGEENHGFYYIMDSFQLERLVAAIMAVSGAQHALDMTLQYINEREVFGRKVNRFQVIRHRLADLATEIQAARQFVYHTCWLYDKGEFAVKDCTMAKLLTSELGKKAADICLQCFGGYGFMEDYPIARMYRDARAGTIVGGTSEIMREIIAKMMFDEAKYDTAYTSSNNDEDGLNETVTARDIILSLPTRFKLQRAEKTPEKAPEGNFHFKINGARGGDFTIRMSKVGCEVNEGIIGESLCTVQVNAEDYEALETGRTDPQVAFMQGLLKVSNLEEMMKFMPMFKRIN